MDDTIVLDVGASETRFGFAGDDIEVLAATNDTRFDRIQAALVELDVDASEHPLLITEAPNASDADRLSLTKRLFGELNTPAVYFAVPQLLALYHIGIETGVVVDVAVPRMEVRCRGGCHNG